MCHSSKIRQEGLRKHLAKYNRRGWPRLRAWGAYLSHRDWMCSQIPPEGFPACEPPENGSVPRRTAAPQNMHISARACSGGNSSIRPLRPTTCKPLLHLCYGGYSTLQPAPQHSGMELYAPSFTSTHPDPSHIGQH